MDKIKQTERLVTFLLFTGLVLNLSFVYFEQERLYRTITTGSRLLGPERYIRIVSVICIFLSLIFSIFLAKTKYKVSIFFAYLTLLTFVTLNYLFSGAELFDMAQFMATRGIGTWIGLGLIFVGYDDQRYRLFQKFLLFSVVFILILVVYNLFDFGIGAYRSQALSKYQIYAVNLIWTVPYVFLILKTHEKLKWIRMPILFMGIMVALICQTRSFLIIYAIVLIYDFYNTKNKTTYLVAIFVGFIAFIFLVLNTEVLSKSLDLLINRGINDTRSEQLKVFLRQLDFFELITGKGFFATYRFGIKQWAAVDNQWLYLLWWAGLVPLLCYFYLAAIIPSKLAIRGKLSYETKVECFVLIIWVLGLTGLAIFSTMSVDFFFFSISIILGRVLYKFSNDIR